MLVTRIASKVIKLPSVLKPKKVTNTAPVSVPSLKPELARDTVELKNTVAEVFDVQKYAQQSPYLSAYIKFYDNYKNVNFNLDFLGVNLIKILEKEPQRTKEFECIAKEISERMQQLKYSEASRPYAVKNLLDLYYHNPEAFKQVMKSEKLIDLFYINGYQLNRNISLNALKEMEKGASNDVLAYYVANSDNVYKSPETIKQLSEFLSKNTTEGVINVTRAVKHAGAFNQVELPKSMGREIKLINKILKPFTKKADFSGYTYSYMMSGSKATNLFDYINGKENLSLADAMQMMKFLPNHLRKKVLEMIKETKIVDDRFKSTTFNPAFVDRWLKNCNFQTTIQHNINIPAGTQGRYVIGDTCNPQHEFIINNVPKEFSFTNVVYDANRNRFILDSNMRVL